MSAVLAEQGSVEWLQAKVGKLGASRFCDVIAKLKDGSPAQSRYDYMIELVTERLTGFKSDQYVSREMLLGIETEDEAVAAYEWANDVEAAPIGWIEHPTIANAGATPDRAIGTNLLEIKVPKSATFVAVKLRLSHGWTGKHASFKTDDEYIAQAMWQLACLPTAEWNDLVYYDPRISNPDRRLYVRRIYRDEKLIAAMEAEAREFLGEVDRLEKLIKETA